MTPKIAQARRRSTTNVPPCGRGAHPLEPVTAAGGAPQPGGSSLPAAYTTREAPERANPRPRLGRPERRGRLQTLRDLLGRIRWDSDFRQGSFRVGYRDRVREEIVRVPLQDVVVETGNRSSCDLKGPSGAVFPFHWVPRVWRDAELLWSRDP
ncbi:MAG: DUF504 domain-containing protein [Deferrisomatales bacterium]